MTDTAELNRLLSLVRHRPELSHVEGLDAFRRLLEKDDGGVLRFLTEAAGRLEGPVRAGVAFVVAEHYLKSGDPNGLRRLFATDDPEVRRSVLNALWGEPPASSPQVDAAVLALALEAAGDPVPEVRAEACSVIQNRAARGGDVSAAVGPLLSLLGDSSGRVRMQAACAVGNLAKRKAVRKPYDLLPHAEALRLNLRHEDFSARSWSAWALWQLSRSGCEIGASVADLARLLASGREDDEESRKYAAGALLHNARASSDNRDRVQRCVEAAAPDRSRKPVAKFLEQLADLSGADGGSAGQASGDGAGSAPKTERGEPLGRRGRPAG